MKSLLSVILLFCSSLSAQTTVETLKADWQVRCWNFETKLWADQSPSKMTISQADGAAKITNHSGIHKHAHFVFPPQLKGDFTFTIEVKGGYELGFLNRAGKDEMLYVELEDSAKFQTYELSRVGTRFTIKRNGRVRPLVHFRFDYEEDIVISLAIKQDESAEVKAYTFKRM